MLRIILSLKKSFDSLIQPTSIVLCLTVLYTEGTTSAFRCPLTREVYAFPLCSPVTQET